MLVLRTLTGGDFDAGLDLGAGVGYGEKLMEGRVLCCDGGSSG